MEFSKDNPRVFLRSNIRDAEYLGKDHRRSLGMAVRRDQISCVGL